MNKTFTWYPNNQVFNKKSFTNPMTNEEMISFTYNPYVENFSEDNKIELKVVGILQPKANMNYGSLGSGFFYTPELTKYILENSSQSEIVDYINNNNKGQSITSGMFGTSPMGITYNYDYLVNLETKEIKSATGFVGSQSVLSIMGGMMGGMMGGSAAQNSYYTLTLNNVGGAKLPSSIAIYPVDFDLKEKVLAYLDDWNDKEIITVNGVEILKENRSEITYTDTLSIIIAMVNTMISVITTALVAFTAISLVVSTVMIGIITYVSVVERTKEIGVIRSLGGSKKDVGHLFNAETFIIGLVAGVLGIGITYLLSIIANVIIGGITGIYTLVALKPLQAIIMVIISIGLTLISGLIPSKSAANMDPVNALRTE